MPSHDHQAGAFVAALLIACSVFSLAAAQVDPESSESPSGYAVIPGSAPPGYRGYAYNSKQQAAPTGGQQGKTAAAAAAAARPGGKASSGTTTSTPINTGQGGAAPTAAAGAMIVCNPNLGIYAKCKCRPGTGGPGCQPCPMGLYSQGGNATSPQRFCRPCPAGLTTAGMGSISKQQCQAAAAPAPPPAQGDAHLDTGAIVGIAVGSAAGVALLAGAAVWLVHKRKRKQPFDRQGSEVAPLPQKAAAVTPVFRQPPPRKSLSLGYTGEDMSTTLKTCKHVINYGLIPQIEESQLQNDPVFAWTTGGLREVSRCMSHTPYKASPALTQDWRANVIWDWINQNYWVNIPSPSKRLLNVQVPPHITQAQYAEEMLLRIKQDPDFPPFRSAVAHGVQQMLQEAFAAAAAQHRNRSGSPSLDSGGYPLRDQGRLPSPEAVSACYGSVLNELLESVLKFHLIAQAADKGAFAFVPGSPLPHRAAIPDKAISFKDYLGSAAAVRFLCELPGVLSLDKETGKVNVWSPAQAIRVGLHKLNRADQDPKQTNGDLL